MKFKFTSAAKDSCKHLKNITYHLTPPQSTSPKSNYKREKTTLNVGHRKKPLVSYVRKHDVLRSPPKA